MNTLKLSVAGRVRGQPRVKSRAFKKGNKVISSVYTPKTADAWKLAIKEEILKNPPEKLMTGPISIFISAYMQRPKSHYRTGKYSHLLKPQVPYYYVNTPDNDNIEKACWDAISDTGIVWKDDRQIYKNECIVTYCDAPNKPGAFIAITEVNNAEGQARR